MKLRIIKLYLFLIILLFSSWSWPMSMKECLEYQLNESADKVVKASSKLKSLKEVESAFRDSDLVIYFHGPKNTFNEYTGKNFPAGQFKSGDTFTTIIIGDELIIGKNIKGYKKDPKIGGPGSHDTLLDHYLPNTGVTAGVFENKAGAIGFGPNGTIYVSGYHAGKDNLPAAEKQRDLILEFCPNCKIEISKKKLKEFKKYTDAIK